MGSIILVISVVIDTVIVVCGNGQGREEPSPERGF
mgnify:CR=1 FL=1